MAKTVEGKRSAKKRQFKPTDDSGKLWEAVRATCAEEFEGTFLQPWNDAWKKRLGEHDNDPELEARAVYRKLRRALQAAVDFVGRHDSAEPNVGGDAFHTLRDWVPRCIEPLLAYSWLTTDELPKRGVGSGKNTDAPLKRISTETRFLRPLAARSELVYALDRLNVFGIERPDGRSRYLTVRELAIVSLLAGNKPGLSGSTREYTPEKVITREGKHILPLLKERGAPWVDMADRGGLVKRLSGGGMIVGPLLPDHLRVRGARAK